MAVTVLRVLGSIVAIPRPMRPCARPGFDGRPDLRPVGGGDAEPDRGAGGAEGLARGEDHRNHGVLTLLTELILEGFGHIAHHTFECTSYFHCSQASGRAAPGSCGGASQGDPFPGPGVLRAGVSFRRGARAAARCQSASDSASSEDSAAEKPSSANRSRRHSSSLSSLRISTLGTVTRRSVGAHSSRAAR
jgi:hypothetical protein